MTKEYGVCSYCQMSHPVISNSNPIWGFYAGESFFYVLQEHQAFGERCKGSFQVPEAVIMEQEKVEEIDSTCQNCGSSMVHYCGGLRCKPCGVFTFFG